MKRPVMPGRSVLNGHGLTSMYSVLSMVLYGKFISFPNGKKLRRGSIADGLNSGENRLIKVFPCGLLEKKFLRNIVNRGVPVLLSINKINKNETGKETREMHL